MIGWGDVADEEEFRRRIDLPLEEKEKVAMKIVKVSLLYAKNPFMSFSGGKRSLALLHLIKRCHNGPLNVLHINTTVEFDDLLNYIEKMRKLWRLNLVQTRCKDIKIEKIEIPEDRGNCCTRLKIEPLKEAIEKYKIDLLFAGSSYDTENSRIAEGVEAGEYNQKIVYPILHFRDADIWSYIKRYNLPYSSLYKLGYSKLDCMPCTQNAEENRRRTNESKDEAFIKESLKRLGYL